MTGLQLGDRRELAGATHLDVYVEKHGLRLFGGEFVRDRPARRARDEAQTVLQIEPVDLVDDAVDIVAEVGALLLDMAVEGEKLFRRPAVAHQRIDAEAPFLERLPASPIAFRRALRSSRPRHRRRSEAAATR